MNNNIYVRSNKTIKSIVIVHLLTLIPLMLYGLYKNGIDLYLNNYVNLFNVLKPLYLFLIGILTGSLVNIIYEFIIKKSKDKLGDVIFSSFHIEYGAILSMIVSPNINIIIFSLVTFLLLFVSKFINNRINTVCVIFIVIYLISYFLYGYNNSNLYELDKSFNLNTLDYLIGRGIGGISSTNIFISLIALLILHITNNIKTNISLSAIISFITISLIYVLISHNNFNEFVFTNNVIFSFIFIATDSVTSSYTNSGTIIYGLLVGLITFGISLLNPIIAPFVAIMIVSLFNNLIDRDFYKNRRV